MELQNPTPILNNKEGGCAAKIRAWSGRQGLALGACHAQGTPLSRSTGCGSTPNSPDWIPSHIELYQPNTNFVQRNTPQEPDAGPISFANQSRHMMPGRARILCSIEEANQARKGPSFREHTAYLGLLTCNNSE